MNKVVNTYSAGWFDLFAASIDPAQTRREVEFLCRQLPLPRFRRLLDVCCGTGRHARLLTDRGYEMTGIDVSPIALAQARRALDGRAQVLEHDMRHIDRLAGPFDAVLLLWQSFGYFDDATNHDVLRQIAQQLSPGGRFVLDIYHRGFFETHSGTRTHETSGVTVTESKRMIGQRLIVELDYDHGGRGRECQRERFDWRIYEPDEIIELSRSVGLRAITRCTRFDESLPCTPEQPRMQLVLEKSPTSRDGITR